MALAMSRPLKHPKTGIYWLRKRVPDELQPIIGKGEVKRSLQTRDPVEAKRRHLATLAELETQWANLRAGPRTLTEREAHELACLAHDHWLSRFKDNPSEQTFWPTDLGANPWALPPPPTPGSTLAESFAQAIEWGSIERLRLQDWCLREADTCLSIHGLVVDEGSRLKLAKAIAAAIQRASLTLARFAKGDFDYQPSALLRPTFGSDTPQHSFHTDVPVKFETLLNGWAAETKPVAKTVYEWSTALRKLATFLGHDDAQRVTARDIVAWKKSLIDEGLGPKTIRDSRLASVRAIFRWGVDNHHLSANPAEKVTIDVKPRTADGKGEYSDEQAAIVLKAALAETDPVRRWVPWLCAYSGARLSEVCQLRVEDILKVEGIWCMRITAEAGSVKTANSERTVPLHPAILESGDFLAFKDKIGAGPLFVSLRPDKFGKRGGTATKILGPWVRSIGITDPKIKPNHGWRHRFTTLRRRHGLAVDLAQAMLGHAPQSVADTYGAYPITAMYRELEKIPTLKLT